MPANQELIFGAHLREISLLNSLGPAFFNVRLIFLLLRSWMKTAHTGSKYTYTIQARSKLPKSGQAIDVQHANIMRAKHAFLGGSGGMPPREIF